MKKKSIVVSLTILLALIITAAAFAETTTVYSDTSVMVYGPLNEYQPVDSTAWGTPASAVVTWKHPSWPTLDPASWISNTYYIEGNIPGNTWRKFSKTVQLCSGAYNISGTVKATADNAEEVYVNGNLIGYDGEVQGAFVDNQEWATFQDYYYISSADTLKFEFIVRNYSGQNSATQNPTGLIFEATVNYDCPIQVQIDIKPGSDPSCFNSNEHGVIPVAIFGSADFDVTQIDVGKVALDGASVAVRGKADKTLAAYEDVNMDGYMDLVVKIVDAGGYEPGDAWATLTGMLYDETHIEGMGDICITQ